MVNQNRGFKYLGACGASPKLFMINLTIKSTLLKNEIKTILFFFLITNILKELGYLSTNNIFCTMTIALWVSPPAAERYLVSTLIANFFPQLICCEFRLLNESGFNH